MIRIGITGHRPHRLEVPEKKLAARVRSVLRGLMTAAGQPSNARGAVLDIISPLAEGCDRIVARQALGLDQRLTALLPLARRDYEATFGSASAIEDFRTLWHVSTERAVLKGLSKHVEASYVAVGMVTLARSDLILTIWDGKPAQGRGGTPEILQCAIAWGIPVIWIHATEDRKPVLLAAGNGGRTGSPLERAVKNVQPLTSAVYRRLVQMARMGGST